jgi:leucyl-tRNA synthetase
MRLFILYASPPERELQWSDEGVAGCYKFVNRVYRLSCRLVDLVPMGRGVDAPDDLPDDLRQLHKQVHATVKAVTHDLGERNSFNTAIARLYELVNALYQYLGSKGGVIDAWSPGDALDGVLPAAAAVLRHAMARLLLLTAPFAPHLSEECWEILGFEGLVCEQPWPDFTPALTRAETISVPLQVNGKVRANIEVEADIDQKELEQLALSNETIEKWLKGKHVRKVIVVPGRLVNVVAN